MAISGCETGRRWRRSTCARPHGEPRRPRGISHEEHEGHEEKPKTFVIFVCFVVIPSWCRRGLTAGRDHQLTAHLAVAFGTRHPAVEGKGTWPIGAELERGRPVRGNAFHD